MKSTAVDHRIELTEVTGRRGGHSVQRDLCSARTLRLRSGQAPEGGRPHVGRAGANGMLVPPTESRQLVYCPDLTFAVVDDATPGSSSPRKYFSLSLADRIAGMAAYGLE